MDIPQSLAELFADREQAKQVLEDIAFARALRKLSIITVDGEARLKYLPGADNASVDITELMPEISAPAGAQSSSHATPYTEVSRASAGKQTIANNTTTAIQFTTEVLDESGAWDAGANTRLTVPAGLAGKWIVDLTIFWDNDATGGRRILVRKNGTTAIVEDARNAGAAGYGTAMTLACVCNLAEGDYIELLVTQTSGGNLDVKVDRCTFTRIGA